MPNYDNLTKESFIDIVKDLYKGVELEGELPTIEEVEKMDEGKLYFYKGVSAGKGYWRELLKQ